MVPLIFYNTFTSLGNHYDDEVILFNVMIYIFKHQTRCSVKLYFSLPECFYCPVNKTENKTLNRPESGIWVFFQLTFRKKKISFQLLQTNDEAKQILII